MLSPMSMPQPVPCVSAMTPSTLGKSASASGKMSRRKRSAIARATVAEQFTLERIAM